jgi:type II restriction enzyme
MLMNYDVARFGVTDLFFVPKQFLVLEVIQEQKPLGPKARRAGWVGCNILLGDIPASGKVWLVRGGDIAPRRLVLEQSTLFLRRQSQAARGWLIEVMKCVELIRPRELQPGRRLRLRRAAPRRLSGQQQHPPKNPLAAAGAEGPRLPDLPGPWALPAS